MGQQVKLFCGIEGGGTKTVLFLMNEQGEVVSRENGGPSNPWLLGNKEDGFDVAASVINELLNKTLNSLKKNENINYCLETIGMCISGAGSRIFNERLTTALNSYENMRGRFYIGNDTLAPIFAAFKDGGIVVISGTGSNCVLVNPFDDKENLKSIEQLKIFGSGGWGNLLGDEGSAYWIAQKAIKYFIDHNDNFILENDLSEISSNEEIDELREAIFEHFQLDSLSDILPFFYSDFKKDFIASLTEKLASLAKNNFIVRQIFEEAGYQIARHIVAIYPKIDYKLLSADNGLSVVCAGSVFKSWHLIKPGFKKCLEDNIAKCPNLNEINLVRVDTESCAGAVYLAAKFYNKDLPLVKNFQNQKFTSQLDHLIIKNFCGILSHQTFNLIQKISNDEISHKEV